MAYTSYNAYIVQNNLAVLLVIAAINYISVVPIPLLSFLLNNRIVILLEWVLVVLCTYNISYAFRGVIVPYIATLNLPYKQDLFSPGPLLVAVKSIYEIFTSETKPTPTKPVVQAKPEESDKLIESGKKLASLFLSKPPQTAPATDLNLQLPDTTKPNPSFKQPLSFESLFVSKPTTQTNFEQQVTGAELKQLSTDNTILNPPGDLGSLITSANQNLTLPQLRYTPCLKPPLKPSAHRERLLWYLSPTTEVIEDFRIEQMIEYQRYWNTFNNRIYYDKLTEILLSKIFTPLSKSIEEYEKILSSKNMSISNCSPRTVALTMTVPHIGTVFNLSEIMSFISLNGYPSNDCKAYVTERLKELCSGKRMAAYRFIPKFPNMPTDAEIILHAFKYYLSIREPYAIPPLIEHEGDVFKFLLIYIKITPELDHWSLFKEN